MKGILRKLNTSMASLALILSVVAANQSCAFYAHQPELPKDVKNLRKF